MEGPVPLKVKIGRIRVKPLAEFPQDPGFSALSDPPEYEGFSGRVFFPFRQSSKYKPIHTSNIVLNTNFVNIFAN
jgi:hypothetical protein